MKWSVAIVGALAALGLAKPAITNLSFNLVEGQPFTLEWTNATGPVTVGLVTGTNPLSLVPFRTLTTGVTTTSYTFTPSGIPSGSYAFSVTDSDTQPNYSILFDYKGTAASSSSGSSTSTRSSTSTPASSAPTSSAPSTSGSSTSSSSTSTRTTATTTRSTPTSTPSNNNEGQRFSSSLAMVFITVAALVFFN